MLREGMDKLTSTNPPLAVALAAIPEKIRGYGHVKEKAIAEARQDEFGELYAEFDKTAAALEARLDPPHATHPPAADTR